MKKATKGLFAAGAGVVLLLSGSGTLAFWSEDSEVGTGSISSGHLDLTGESCSGWVFDGGDPYGAESRIVPGDVLTQVCTFTVDAVGDHLTASFDVVTPSFAEANALTSELDLAATYQVNGAPVSGQDVAVLDDDVVTATVTATFDSASTTGENLTAVLESATVTVTQAHN